MECSLGVAGVIQIHGSLGVIGAGGLLRAVMGVFLVLHREEMRRDCSVP